MYLDSFIKYNKEKSIMEKVKLLYDTTIIKCRNEYDAYEASIRGSQKTARYLSNEADAMDERIEWIYNSIKEDLIKAGIEVEDNNFSKIPEVDDYE